MVAPWTDPQRPRVRWDEQLVRPVAERIDRVHPEGDAELVGRTVRGVRLDLTDFDAVTFEDCVVESCHVVASRDTEVRVVRSAFSWCDLSGVRVSKGCARSTFRECKLASADFGGGSLQDVRLDGSILTDVSLRSSSLRRVEFEACRVEDLDARGATLEHVAFGQSTLLRADLGQATCFAVDLAEVAELSVRRAAALAGCRISVPQAVDLALALASEAGLVIDVPDED